MTRRYSPSSRASLSGFCPGNALLVPWSGLVRRNWMKQTGPLALPAGRQPTVSASTYSYANVSTEGSFAMSRLAISRRRLAMRVRVRPRVRRVRFSFPAEPLQAAVARRRVAALLTTAWGEGQDVDDATLVASEVLTNGCLHGGGRVRVHASINRQAMRLRVSTPARWNVGDGQSSSTCDDESGRGLEIVRALAQTFLVARGQNGAGTSVTVVCLAQRSLAGSVSEGEA